MQEVAKLLQDLELHVNELQQQLEEEKGGRDVVLQDSKSMQELYDT